MTLPRAARFACALLLGTCIAASPVAVAAPNAGEARAIYDVSFAGFGIARGSLAVRVERGAYAAKVQISTAGLARIISSEESVATAKGRIGKSISPASYELMSRGERVTQVSMGIGGGRVRQLSAVPELSEREDRIPIKSSHKRGIIDPLSAALAPVPAKSGKAVCDRTLPIFDGWTRYDIRLFYKSTEMVDVPGYKGEAFVCGARWVPVAGHREGKESTRFMAENKELEASFVPTGEGVMLPFRIAVRTMKGMLVVKASRFEGELGAVKAN